ncbi:lactonase family protein [Streptomyces nodosus]|uniref:lactonase family protein n=1 Tax=Streptomyces nodosus TaxID=40318 RepID=UPI0007C75B13|nr:lactonase family protein [Streptomyces nodosus]MBB4789573.1 6-phosphogluconolactonase (cycloisomerase 2 family) [Streptomyces nodosus]
MLTAVTAASALPLLSAVPSAAAPGSRGHDLLYIGTWGQNQVHAVRFDPVGGTMTPLGRVAEISSSWVAVHPHRPVLYVAGAEQGGFIRSFRIDDSTGAVRQTGEIETEPAPTGSGGLSYIAPTADAGALLVADFAAGSAVTVSLTGDGGLGAVASSVQDAGSGPDPRQAGPHPHHVVIDPSGRFALVVDFGADRAFVYDYDRAAHQLSAGSAGPGSFATAPGSGPRRLAFHPDGRTVYLLSELTAELQVLDWDVRHGMLTSRQLLTTNAPDHTGSTSAAELVIARDGGYVYTSNRGDNALVVFSAARRTGLLTEVQRVPCGGVTPWSMCLHSSGRWLFVANEASSTVNLFRVHPRSGRLTDTGRSVAVPNPASISVRHPDVGAAGSPTSDHRTPPAAASHPAAPADLLLGFRG